MKRAAELRAAALQRKQQEQQARQQQQNLLKMNKKKVQNAIKTQQRKVTSVYKPPAVNPAVTYKPTVTAPVPLGALRRTLPVVRPTVPTKLPGIQPAVVTAQMRTQIAPRTTVTAGVSPTPYVQRLQPKPQVTQRVYVAPAQATSTSQISRATVAAATPGYTGRSSKFAELSLLVLSGFTAIKPWSNGA